MKKNKTIHIILVICFIFITGISYTVTYIKPWKRKGVILSGESTSLQALAAESTPIAKQPEKVKEDVTRNVSDNLVNEQHTSVEVQKFYIHICGAVKESGVYQANEGDRLCDLVESAGGFSEDAAQDYVNLAQPVADGQKYYIPTKEEVKDMEQFAPSQVIATNLTALDDAKENGSTNKDHLININTAAKDELMTLKGVGEARAETIIAYREQNGSFDKIEDIMKVTGIKEGLFQKIRGSITVK